MQRFAPAYAYPSRPPPIMPNFPPPLPAGWSEHTGSSRLTCSKLTDIIAPDGYTKYYYNSQSRDSTYIRPSIPGPFPSFPPPAAFPTADAASSSNTPAATAAKKKKDKPREKVVIPGTSWTRITTNEGNVFYFEKESKRSEWSVPEEIKEEVAVLETEEAARKEAAEREEKEKAEAERLERLRERERIRAEVREERKRIALKRKEREDNGEGGEPGSKMAKRDGENGDEEGEGEFGPQNEEDEEAWMRAVAAEFADADRAVEEEKIKDKETVEREEEEAAKKVFAVPEKVNVTLEEGRALFKVGTRQCGGSS